MRYEIEEEDSYVVIATDGVFDVMEDEDVFQLSKKQKNAKDFCEDVMKEAVERGSMDNISCFVVGLK